MQEPDQLLNDAPAAAAGAYALLLAARLAARLLNAPIAAIGFKGVNGSWRNVCTCNDGSCNVGDMPGAMEALTARGVVCRTYTDGEHPLAGVRFSAAIALLNGEVPVGVLAVMDIVPRKLEHDDFTALESLGNVVVHALGSLHGALIDFTLDMSGRFTAVDAGLDRTGFVPGELLGANILEYVPAHQHELVRDRLLAQYGAGRADGFEFELRSRKGPALLLNCRTRLVFENGRPSGIHVYGRDLTSTESRTARGREAESELLFKTEQLARFSEHLRELHRLNTTRHGSLDELYTRYLASGCAMFRLPAGIITDDRGAVIASHPDALEALLNPIISATITCGGDTLGVLAFGSQKTIVERQYAPHDHDVAHLLAQSIGHAVLAARLEHERDVLNLHLQLKLRQDALTGLPNRLGLFEWIENALRDAGGAGQRLALLFIDLDRFKQINDTLGHNAGDDLLTQVAGRLTAFTRPQDHVARMGGDEFTFVLTGDPTDELIAKHARVLLDALRAPYVVNDYELFITASIGISVFPACGADAKALLHRADAAMYRAKNHKNDFQFFTADLEARTMNRLDLEIQLRRAIEHDELEMRFQPIVNLEGTLEGLETLLAWDNPKFGKVGPSRFIPIAEESGMIVPIGLWVLQQACIQNARWQASGYAPVHIAVNVSAMQFARTDFVDRVAEALKQSGMPPECLELELTESLIMRDVDESSLRMARIRALGVSISIDDFGTGYSSLSYLRRLPVDTLKIDRSFLADLLASKSSLPLIQTIVALAHNMGLAVVAEGVETEEQLVLLRDVGCDRVQGHLFGEALRADAVAPLLRRAPSESMSGSELRG